MSSIGMVCTGFSKPYVAIYGKSNNTITYSSGQRLARGVSVTASPETSDDNKFYADNIEAENAVGKFTGGTLNITVDGLLSSAEQLIMGLPEADAQSLVHYDDDQVIPDCGVGFIGRYQSEGTVVYRAIIFPRVTFNLPEVSAATQEDAIEWQTQELTATIKRAEDAKRTWKYIGLNETSEAMAEQAIKNFFDIQ